MPLAFITSILWRAVNPGTCQMVIHNERQEAPTSPDPMAGSSHLGKLSQLPHDPLYFLPSISLGWMVG